MFEKTLKKNGGYWKLGGRRWYVERMPGYPTSFSAIATPVLQVQFTTRPRRPRPGWDKG